MIQLILRQYQNLNFKSYLYYKKYYLIFRAMMGTTLFRSADKEESAQEFPPIFNELQNSLDKDNSNLYEKIQKAIIGNFSQEEKEKIKGLIGNWSDQFMKLEDMIDDEELFSEQSIKYYFSIDCLAARVYLRITDYFVRVRNFNDMKQEQLKELKDFCHLMNKEELVFSYDRFFWGRRTIKNKYYSQSNEKERRQQVKTSLNKVYEQVINCSNATLNKVYIFMSRLQIINISQDIEVTNQLILKLQSISKEDQKIQFLHSLQAKYLLGLYDVVNQSIKFTEQQEQTRKSIKQKLPNYLFYHQDKQKSVSNLHARLGDYKFLEQRHDYIQWMFPNHYGSAFNSKSSPLSYLEKRLFINDPIIGFRMLKSIYTFFDFMGIRINLKDLSLKVISYPRLKAVILINFHNHLRIMRVLACLSVIGFRKIALNLIKLLDQQTSQKGCLVKQREEFERSWDIYGDESSGVPKQRAKQMCFHQDDKFPQDHSILQLLHKLASKQQDNVINQIKNQMKIQDIQQFNPQPTQQNQVSVNKLQNFSLEQMIPQQKVQQPNVQSHEENLFAVSVIQEVSKVNTSVDQAEQPNIMNQQAKQYKTNNIEIQLKEANQAELNIASVPQIEKTEKENGLAEKSDPETYLANIECSQIAAKNITTATQSE